MRRRLIESFLALVSVLLFVGLGCWMLYSDHRFDQIHVAKLLVRGSNGKVMITYGDHALSQAPFYLSLPYVDDLPSLKWRSFTYSETDTMRSVVVPAWLPLLMFAIMPGVWIYGMPSRPKREAEPNTDQATVSSPGFGGLDRFGRTG